MLDKIRINRPHLLKRSALTGRLSGLPPSVLNRRPKRRLRTDRRLLLTGRTAQDVKHFSSPIRTGRDEQRVRRMQAGLADGFSVRDAALGQPVAVIVGVS